MSTHKPTIKKWNQNGNAWDIIYPKTTIDQVVNLSTSLSNMQADVDDKLDATAKAADSEKLDGKDSDAFIYHGEVLMNTNPFGGRKLYISAMDNALHDADRRFFVEITRHSVSHNSDIYPKLNPNWVERYTYSVNGNQYTITNSIDNPPGVVIFDGTTLKYEVTHYTYDQLSGVVTLNFTPSNSISIFPDFDTPEYLDSPVLSTYSEINAHRPFDGSYETGLGVAHGEYIKVRVMGSSSGHSIFGGYPYGKIYASFYHTGKPEKVEYRAFNYSYYNHGVGWKKRDFSGNISTSTSYDIQSITPPSDYGRTIMEFIVYGRDTSDGKYTTSLTQLDWKKDRPNLVTDGATITKFGAQSLHYDFNWLDGAPKVNGNEVYHPNNKPTPANIGALALTGGELTGNLTLKKNGTTDVGSKSILFEGNDMGADFTKELKMVQNGSKLTFNAKDIILNDDARLTDDRNAADVSAWAKAATKPTYSASEVGAEPVITTKNTAFNKNFGSVLGSVCQGNDARLSDARNAADVSAWAKASTKPSYTWSEIGSKPVSLLKQVSFSGGVLVVGTV